ncbi:hypothetical protein PPERSA_10930 [Pseudocohnilembus persalinus]|uniref:Uncharacterized protein n=1 Tax=Pseudocohnilembus persalinus TaxID=266149 RepID=A0A0V0R9K9_PSEPJ|nr:hypothetical protein PPERSA_10930 [Pseudocohnilembus persalinus]|eukprot:KRX11163.1 hypothetical protein PPERSA_10930 [Pseudocohnilembus persalinus]
MSSQKPKYLTQAQAEKRFSFLKQGTIHYKLHMRYNKGKNYEGQVEVSFELSDNFTANDELIIDINTEKILSLYINENKIQNINYDGLFVHMPGSNFKLKEKNTIFINYKNFYANDGNGLHSFVDSDEKQYIYSQCEAYFCNRIFPVFDQPDLKCTLSLEIDAPADFTVLFNTNEDKSVQKENQLTAFQNYQQEVEQFKSQTPSDYVHHSFPRTLPLPSYLFGFIAGPFSKISNPNKNQKIPMNIYCRESLLKYTQDLSEYIFEVTEQSMEVYEQFFGYKFAFPKYDQIFCPEFNCGAMENAGLVTFNDLYIFKEAVDAVRLTNFANTITHELAHHWFGNLVTMKWWNDLWLNESFADFISHFCLTKMNVKSRQNANVWSIFNNRKGWGYRADQLATTHPIAGDVPNTEAAESIFDGITYAKGASSLRQLLSLMGEEAFSAAMTKYFNKYAFKYQILSDFIANLNEYMSSQKPSLNECFPHFDPSNTQKQATLKIKQSVALSNHPTLRFHKMKVAFFKENGEIQHQDVILQPQEITEIQYDGSQNYKAVLLNYEDETFIKILLDQHSIEFFKKNLCKVQDLLTRTLIWRSFYDMVRDGKLNSEEYIDIFIQNISKEQSDEIIGSQFSFMTVALHSLTPKKFQEQLGDKLFNFTIKYLSEVDKNNTNKVVSIKKNLPSFAFSEDSLDQLVQWYNKKHSILNDFEIGLSAEWSIIKKIHQSPKFSLEEKNKYFDLQAEKDQSDTLKNMRAYCDAAIATPEQREQLYKQYTDPNSKEMSLRTKEYSIQGFNNRKRVEQLQGFYERWYNDLVPYAQNFQTRDHISAFFNGLLPITDDIQGLIDKLVKKYDEVNNNHFEILRKSIQESIDDLRLKLRAHNCFYANAKLANAQNL